VDSALTRIAKENIKKYQDDGEGYFRVENMQDFTLRASRTPPDSDA
jgi:hypothetical protein